MKRWWQEGILFLIALVVVLLDQGTKLWATANLNDGRIVPVVGDILRLRYTTNTGAAFGLFQDQGSILAIIALVVVTVILIYYRRMPGQLLLVRVSLGLQLGGAIGNLLDRLHHGGSVVDFIEFVLWPVFNIADAAIVAGVGLLAYYLIFMSSEEQPAPELEPTPSDAPGDSTTDL
ncbi:MAG: signal peptidase II [Chloroflexi bacterium]|nr:signal peptidase II [Chloroflexota bacterium]MBU1747742.1 signal peptidase II [Chloroflexota bacterium]MBU1878993.1 signal peptidase II [Chloroflexota bacterium]